MRKAVCSGSFDPVTIGHIDIIERASRMFDEIIVCVFYNPGKATSLFTPKERVEMLKAATSHLPNVRVTSCSGLLNEFCEKEKASFIVRGLRAFTDFEYEFQRALLLKKISFWQKTAGWLQSIQPMTTLRTLCRKAMRFSETSNTGKRY